MSGTFKINKKVDKKGGRPPRRFARRHFFVWNYFTGTDFGLGYLKTVWKIY
jgi:hypothetical protein